MISALPRARAVAMPRPCAGEPRSMGIVRARVVNSSLRGMHFIEVVLQSIDICDVTIDPIPDRRNLIKKAARWLPSRGSPRLRGGALGSYTRGFLFAQRFERRFLQVQRLRPKRMGGLTAYRAQRWRFRGRRGSNGYQSWSE